MARQTEGFWCNREIKIECGRSYPLRNLLGGAPSLNLCLE